METLRGELTTSQLATKHGIHQTMIGDWKRQAVEDLVSVFSGKEETKEDIVDGKADMTTRSAVTGKTRLSRF